MYLFYVDESGQREYNNVSSLHFVLGAVGIEDTNWREWNQKINALKMEYFGTHDVEFKSVALRRPESRKKVYLDPFSISEERLTEAIETLYGLIVAAPITLFAAVIDKKQIMRQYADPVPATPMAYELLLERVASYLKGCGGKPCGIMIHDLIQEVAGKAKSHQREIAQLHDRFQNRGRTDFINVEQIIEGVHFLPTDQSNFLQIADLITYDVFRQFRDHWQEWDAKVAVGRMRLYPFFSRLLPKFYRSDGGSLRGYGIKKFPNK